MPHATTHRVLFIDAYDSFTNNIIDLLETNLGVSVTSIKIDEPIPNFADFLEPFSAVIAGPGPGDPRNSKDVGWIRELWKLEGQDLLPVLGICLGFQSLVLAFGGSIDRLREPRHGIVRRVRGCGEGIFRGVAEVETVQYHSLHASLEPEAKSGGMMSNTVGMSPLKCSALRALAWDYETDNIGDRTEIGMSVKPWRIMMAVEHKTKPFFGVQFHAESICSSGNARKIVEAWWEMARKWRRPRRNIVSLPNPRRSSCTDLGAVQVTLIDEHLLLKYRRRFDVVKHPSMSLNGVQNGAKQFLNTQEDSKQCNGCFPSQGHGKKVPVRVTTSVIEIGEATVPSICETLGLKNGEAIILDSEMHQRREVGEHSIIGLVYPNSLRLEYQVGTNEIRQIQHGRSDILDLGQYGGCIFSCLEWFMSQYKVENSNARVPFWGGLMGYIGYEACLETIGITQSQYQTKRESKTPDLSFVFVERSIVIDHSRQKIHVQSIKPGDQDWVDKTTSLLTRSTSTFSSSKIPKLIFPQAQTSLPDAASYKSKIRACQSAIRAGESYELCLTTQATITTQDHLVPWQFFLRLRSLNSAPFSAYVRLGRLTLLSSSPERFLQWSRPTRSSDSIDDTAFDREERTIKSQFRPIKGTVQRRPNPNLPPLTLAEATALLATPKERAENLMIVDLIRHDLHGIVGSGRVSVPKLMVVEEYATLFQLVSVIEGSLVVKDTDDENSSDDTHAPSDIPNPLDTCKTTPCTHAAKSGIDILAASLPPGSMTGAPKLRSCQHLLSLEDRPRGIYSGVLGYLDIGGGGDFSVVIRSAVRWDDAAHSTPEANGKGGNTEGDDITANGDATGKEGTGDEWTIGAGGAVTSLSTEDGEWEEMVAKMRSTLRLFEPYDLKE